MLMVKVPVQIVEKHRVKAIYLAPTAIRDMMAHDDMHVRRHDRSSLEVRKPW
jgi:acyl-coenzyme A synthetase/AMP-(fatty) acid ligase